MIKHCRFLAAGGNGGARASAEVADASSNEMERVTQVPPPYVQP
jgi:hypothetical protein